MTIDLYRQYLAETGDPVAASNLVLAHAMLAGQERQYETAITVQEAARRLKLSAKTIYQMCESGTLGHQRVAGRSIRIQPSDLDAYLRRQDSPPPPTGKRGRSGMVL